MEKRVLARYQLAERLGQGGMGEVYAALDPVLGRRVAVKVCRPGAAARRLIEEARSASALAHPNIARIYDFGETPAGEPFVVMELLEGQTLAALLQAGPLPEPETRRILAAVAEALHCAHSAGITHRDIKPANIQLTPAGEVKVLDFGLASRAEPEDSDATRTSEGLLSGTPAYLAPELARGGAADARSDLFALGVVLYECLTGRRPFPGANALEVLAAVLSHEPAAPPGPLGALALRLLQKDPARRVQSAAELLQLLSARPAAPRRPWKLYAALAASLAVVAAGLWFAAGPAPYQPRPEAARWYDRGLSALYDGSYLKASRALEQAVALDPGFRMAHAHLAEAWVELEYVGRAKDAMLRAEPPGGALARLSTLERTHIEAIHYTVQGDHAQAAQLYTRLLDLQSGPARLTAQLDLGRAHERRDDYPQALAAYREAVRLDPQSAAAWLKTGQLEARLKRRPEAESAYEKAAALYRAASNPEGLTEVQLSRALLEKAAGHGLEAEKLAAAALDAARQSQDVQHQIRLLLQFCDLRARRGDVRQARQDAEQAIELARENGIENLTTRALIDLANALQIAGEVAPARRYYEQALAAARRGGVAKTEARALVNLGGLLLRLGEVDNAIAALEKARDYYEKGRYSSQAFSARLLIARARLDQGQLPQALREYADLAGRASAANERALAAEGLGDALYQLERYRDAAARYEEARALHQQAGSKMGAGYAQAHHAASLAQLGEPARPLLAPVLDLAARDGLKDLQTAAHLVEATMALAQSQPAAGLRALESARALGEPLPPEVEVTVLTRAGRPAEAWSRCNLKREGLALAKLQLACAEAALLAARPAESAALARSALAVFEASALHLSVFRAAALLARAEPGAPARQRAAAAREALRLSLAAADFDRLARRPDLIPLVHISTNLGVSP